MMVGVALSIGLEYVDAVYDTITGSDFSQYTITGMKALALLFFLINIIKKYHEGIASRDGHTWGLTPTELAKNFAVVLLVLFSDQVLDAFDTILVGIETQYRSTAPDLLPLQLQEISIEEDAGIMDAARKGMALLYEALVSPLFGMRLLAFIISVFLWLLDLFIYPLFLAERFFLLGIMRAFFPLVISLAVFEKFRTLAYSFFKLYVAVYMLVPAFFLVNIFINALYGELTDNFWVNLFGTDYGSSVFAPLVELGTIGFIVFLKFKLYRRATSFSLKLFGA
ncbi:MAG: hypothetical protein H2058_11810 [Muricauda sp.]|nr:hypothetical protein [Allomuricauda sp.]MBA4745931.1 hypothetical protein [Allomuricauda sp.]